MLITVTGENELVIRYFLHDALGNVIALTDPNQEITAVYQYDGWGNVLISPELQQVVGLTSNPLPTEVIHNPYRWGGAHGYYMDEDTGMYLIGLRWYESFTGRFLTKDPIGFAAGDPNLFRPMGNNPINAVDPEGTDIIYLFDPKPIGGAGHAAVLIGNDQDGWLYFSFSCGDAQMSLFGNNAADNLDYKKFPGPLTAVRKNPALSRYKKYMRWITDKKTDAKAIAAARAFFDRSYNLCTRNCDDVAAEAIKAAGISFVDKWKPKHAYNENKGKADEYGDW